MRERVDDAPGWPTALVGLLVIWLTTLWLYRGTLGTMMSTWASSDTYAHGFVVPLIALWLVWRIRRDVVRQPIQPSLPTLGLLLTVVLFWFAGDLVAANAVTQLALVLMIILAVPTALGWGVTRTVAFPLGFLLFAVPIGDFMLPQLMEWTADFTVLALRWSGIPVYREGLQFVIPSGTWSVVEACSGIRYLIASVTVGSLFAYLSYRSLRKRLSFVGIAIVVPLVANWLRAYLIVMIGHLSGNELATGVDHLIYGWVFFGIVILAMLLIGARWADAPAADGLSTPAQPVVALRRDSVSTVRFVGTLLVMQALLGLPILLHAHVDRGIRSGSVQLSAPSVSAGWTLATEPPADLRPSFRHPSATAAWGFASPDGAAVGLHISYYRQQSYERKLVSSVNQLVSSKDGIWSQTASTHAEVEAGGRTLRVVESQLRQQGGALTSDSRRLLAWRFYWVNGRFTASDIEAKLQGALSRLSGRGDDGAIVVLFVPMLDGATDEPARVLTASRAPLEAFVRAQLPQLGTALERVWAQE